MAAGAEPDLTTAGRLEGEYLPMQISSYILARQAELSLDGRDVIAVTTTLMWPLFAPRK